MCGIRCREDLDFPHHVTVSNYQPVLVPDEVKEFVDGGFVPDHQFEVDVAQSVEVFTAGTGTLQVDGQDASSFSQELFILAIIIV